MDIFWKNARKFCSIFFILFNLIKKKTTKQSKYGKWKENSGLWCPALAQIFVRVTIS